MVPLTLSRLCLLVILLLLPPSPLLWYRLGNPLNVSHCSREACRQTIFSGSSDAHRRAIQEPAYQKGLRNLTLRTRVHLRRIPESSPHLNPDSTQRSSALLSAAVCSFCTYIQFPLLNKAFSLTRQKTKLFILRIPQKKKNSVRVPPFSVSM